MSIHHSVGRQQSYTCDDHSDGVYDFEFADAIKLCNGAYVNLNLCNGCDMAQKILDKNPDVKQATIQCVNGESRHQPDIDVDFTWRWNKYLKRSNDWNNDEHRWMSGTYPSQGSSLPALCESSSVGSGDGGGVDLGGGGSRCQNYPGMICNDTYR